MEFTSWLVDQFSPDEAHLFRRSGAIFATQTQFQELQYLETATYGHVMVLDGAVQSAQLDEHVYHEALVHPAMMAHCDPRRVLILGGGEGATLREVLKHPSVEQAVMVDLDGELVEFCKQHMSTWHAGAFDDPRTVLLHEDGRAYLENHADRFDVILIDITDGIPDGPAAALYTQEFYALCRSRLTHQGILGVQGFALSLAHWDEHAVIRQTIRSVFANAESYSIFIPSFLSTWGFILATQGIAGSELESREIAQRILDRGLNQKLRVYDELIHPSLFALPKELRQKLDQTLTVLHD